jgi:hypothetical protein
MAQNENSGSDLDVFEGLAKKSPSVPSPSGSRSVPPPPPPASGRPGAMEGKRTLLGVAAPALPPPSSHPSRLPPPPPPGRGSLPPVVAAPPTGVSSLPPAPPPPSASSFAAAPAPPASEAGLLAAPASAIQSAQVGANAAVGMDWDEEDEATQIFDENSESTKVFDDEADQATKIVDPLSLEAAPPASPRIPEAKATLLGLTAPLGTRPVSTLPPPGSGRQVSRPPPPPPASGSGLAASGGMVPRMPSGFPAPSPSLPPPTINPFPPALATTPGLGLSQQTRTMPPSGPHSLGHVPIPRSAPVPDFLSSQRRAMEETAMVRPPPNRTMLFAALGTAAVVAIAGALFWPSHPGRIVVNVTDSQGTGINHVEIFVDGRKQCDTSPCVVDQVAAGPHDVKLLADGFDAPAVQTVTVESRKDSAAAFTLGSSAGTGIKVGGTQPGVKLYVDDKESGPLPQELRDLSPGDHVIKVAGSERYQPLEKHVSVERQKVQDLGTVTLKVLKGKATISLGTSGARVFLVSGADRRELPTLPISVDIDTGKSWALEATRPGFSDYHQSIAFDDGQAERTYMITLEPRAASAAPVAYSAPSPSPVAAVRTTTALAAAPAAGGEPAGEAGEAFLTMNSIPPSTCFLDGRSLGSTPKVHVTVKPGSHTVKYVDADGLTKTLSVSVAAGETKAAVAKLN